MNDRVKNALTTIVADKGEFINDLILNELATKEAVTEVAIDLGDPRYMYLVARYIDGVNIHKLAQAVIRSNSAKYMYKFAKYVKGAPRKILAKKVIATKNAKYIFKFAKYMGSVLPMEEFGIGIVNTLDADYMYSFAQEVKNAPTNILVPGVIKTRSIPHAYYFLRDINLDKEERKLLIEAIIIAKNLEYICYLILEYNEYSSYLIRIVLDSEDIEYIKYLILHTNDLDLKNTLIEEYEKLTEKPVLDEMSNEAKMLYLQELYYQGDMETIREYLDTFKEAMLSEGNARN